MAMTLDSERGAFEKWAMARGMILARTAPRLNLATDEYWDDAAEQAWQAWRARAHLTQPAQAVDVGAIREALVRIAAENHKSALTLGQEGLRGQCIQTAKELHELTRHPASTTPDKEG